VVAEIFPHWQESLFVESVSEVQDTPKPGPVAQFGFTGRDGSSILATVDEAISQKSA